MGEVVYKEIRGTSAEFQIMLDDNNRIISLKNSFDRYKMNWAAGSKTWGTIKSNKDLSVTVSRSFTDSGSLLEEYCFRNDTEFDIFTLNEDVGIYVTFPDYYTDAAACMSGCCNTHLWCSGAGSYIMALRMGGEGPHLGMILKEGGLNGYAVERIETTDGPLEELSNHRGDFILCLENFCLRPGESYTLAWELFWFQEKSAFEKRLHSTADFISIEAPGFLLIEGEALTFTVKIGGCPENASSLQIKRDGKQVPFKWNEGAAVVEEAACTAGEYSYEILWKGKASYANFLVQPRLSGLVRDRCRFIAQRQQHSHKGSCLDGAYLIYDNREHCQYYSHLNDHNGGRERVGMGVLLAHYLQHHYDPIVEKSLDIYTDYVLRELFDEKTGEVFNDAGRCRDYIRLYNYPWAARFFLELYLLKKDLAFLERYYKCINAFYRGGGTHYYAIGIPMEESIRVFRAARRGEQARRLLDLYKAHGDFMLECGKNYPPHEVNYEQSIVAPAAIYMCELYALTKEEKYRTGAVIQLEILDLFQGSQPDYHMNEAAIRHWDGFWFGKRRMLGDTFPHYWSALSGYAFCNASKMLGLPQYEDSTYQTKIQKTLRAPLSLYRENGTASCAMVYPLSVNGKSAHFYDEWANDQDWGMYYFLKKANAMQDS